MADQVWRPLGVDTEEKAAEYDALHDGIPDWMKTAYWRWVRKSLTYYKKSSDYTPQPWPNPDLAETMCQRLRIPLPEIRYATGSPSLGQKVMGKLLSALRGHDSPLQIADYLLAHAEKMNADELDIILKDSKSAWQVGSRNGWAGLERRVPEGVQVAADDVMSRAGQAGSRLARAWEQLYGVNPDPSGAYRSAILAVEEAAVPVVAPKDKIATLGKVISQIEDSAKWDLPMEREHGKAPSKDVLVSMMRMLWHGQHDRHGGQPSAPGNVSQEEATVAVSLAVTLVHWFDAGLVAQEAKS